MIQCSAIKPRRRPPALDLVGPGVVGPGDAGDVEVRPWQPARELLQEDRGGHRAARPPAGIGHVGDIALQLIEVVVQRGHRPAAVAGALTHRLNRRQKRRRRAEHAGHDAAQRDHAGAGQGGDIDQVRCAELPGKPQPVAEKQPALGVGVVHLHRLARRGPQDVSGLDGAAVRHVFGRRYHADHANGGLQQRRGAQRADDGGASCHVDLHPVHSFGGLDRDPAGVERNSLPDQAEHRAVGAIGRAVIEDDHAGGLGAALPDTQHQPHPARSERGFVEHLDGKSRGRQRTRPVGEHGGREHVRGLVAQGARQIRALGEHGATPYGILEG
jgi:hypothetical protein